MSVDPFTKSVIIHMQLINNRNRYMNIIVWLQNLAHVFCNTDLKRKKLKYRSRYIGPVDALPTKCMDVNGVMWNKQVSTS